MPPNAIALRVSATACKGLGGAVQAIVCQQQIEHGRLRKLGSAAPVEAAINFVALTRGSDRGPLPTNRAAQGFKPLVGFPPVSRNPLSAAYT